MLTSQIIDMALNQFIDDTEKPVTYNDAYLAQCATEAEKEACRRAKLILDKSTQSEGILRNSAATSTLAGKLIDSGASFNSSYVGKTVYNTTDTKFATITAVDSTTQLSLSDDIMVVGKAYVIGDESKAISTICIRSGVSDYKMSGKILKIQSCYMASNGFTLQQKTKNWLDKFYYKWRSAKGVPKFYLEEKGYITLVPQPDTTINSSTGKDTLFLSSFRLPLNDLTLKADSAPEIPEEYHFDLVYWICYLVFSKQNNSGNIGKASYHETQFNMKFGTKLSAHDEMVLREMNNDFSLDQSSFGIYNTCNY